MQKPLRHLAKLFFRNVEFTQEEIKTILNNMDTLDLNDKKIFIQNCVTISILLAKRKKTMFEEYIWNTFKVPHLDAIRQILAKVNYDCVINRSFSNLRSNRNVPGKDYIFDYIKEFKKYEMTVNKCIDKWKREKVVRFWVADKILSKIDINRERQLVKLITDFAN